MRTLLFFALLLPCAAQQQPSETNVIFGTYSGLSLLMDVYKPSAAPNGYGIVVIPGSGWHRGLAYNAELLKQSREFSQYLPKLSAAGYTTFVITHRAAPRFHFPDAVDDAQRAVRFVRQNAAKYGIDKDRIGAFGASSGGHLVSMLGTLDGKGSAESGDPVEQQSSRVQCVVALYPVTDPAKVETPNGLSAVTSFMGAPARIDPKRFREAAPLTYVSADDPPFLLIHGDADRTVPYSQSEALEAALKKVGVSVKLVRVPGGDHGPDFPGNTQKMDWPSMVVNWFDSELRRK
ncbi:MAG: alpha/beta hydrolase [Bryobacteraceae bacterium]|nr:alpha/beta hydrolase [Bryobacteraceae bacterium]